MRPPGSRSNCSRPGTPRGPPPQSLRGSTPEGPQRREDRDPVRQREPLSAVVDTHAAFKPPVSGYLPGQPPESARWKM